MALPIPAGFTDITDDPDSIPKTEYNGMDSNPVTDYDGMISDATEQYGVPYQIGYNLLKTESDFDPNAKSSAGALGIAQFMPDTAAELGVDPLDPKSAIPGSMNYLRKQYDRFGSWDKAVAAYNAGPGNVEKYGGIPPFEETQAHNKKVMEGYVPEAPAPEEIQTEEPVDTPPAMEEAAIPEGFTDVTDEPAPTEYTIPEGFTDITDTDPNQMTDREIEIAWNKANKSEIRRGFESNLQSTQGLVEGAIGLLGSALGIDAVRDWGYKGYQRNQQEAELNPVSIERIEDIKNPGDTAKWVFGTIGALGPSVAEMAVTTMIGSAAGGAVGGPGGGAAGGILGAVNKGLIKKYVEKQIGKVLTKKAFVKLAEKEGKEAAESAAAKIVAKQIGGNIGLIAGSATLESGGNFMTEADKVGIEKANPYSAAAFGLVSGATELFTPSGRVIRKALGLSPGSLGGLSKIAAKRILAKAGTKEFFKTVTKNIPKSMGQEGAQELVQQFLSAMNAFVNDPEEKLLSKENISEYANSFAAGAVGGLLFGAVEGKSRYSTTKKEAQTAVAETGTLDSFQQNQKKIVGLEANKKRTPEDEEELLRLKQESDWIKTTPEFKEGRKQRINDLTQELENLEKIKKPNAEDQKTISQYKAELGDLTDLSENNRQFEADPLDAANNSEFLEKFVQQGTVGATKDQWNEYGEFVGDIAEQQRAKAGIPKTKKEIAAARKRAQDLGQPVKPLTQAEKNQKTIDEFDKLVKRTVEIPETDPKEGFNRQQAAMDRYTAIEKAQVADWVDKGRFVPKSIMEKYPELMPEVKTIAATQEDAAAQQKIYAEQVAPYFNKKAGSTTMSMAGIKARNPITSKEGKAKLLRGKDKMAAAAAGKGSKRDPITVYKREDGTTVVVDGNTTYHILQEMGVENVAVTEAKTLLQTTEDLDKLYEGAEASRDDLKNLTESVAKETGGTAHFRKDNAVKSRSRAEVKAENYGTAGKLKDIIASTISFKTEAELRKALKKFDANNAVLEVKDRFKNPMNTGYRDVSMTVRMPNGHYVEIQFTTDNMLSAKKAAGHTIYEIARELGTINRPSAKQLRSDLEVLSKKYYDTAFAAPPDSSMALSSVMVEEVKRISDALSGEIKTLLSPSSLKSFQALSSQTKGTPSESKNVSAIKSPPVDLNVTSDKKAVKDRIKKIKVPDVMVSVKYEHEKTGAIVETSVSAQEAMADLDKQEGIIDKIINCMG